MRLFHDRRAWLWTGSAVLAGALIAAPTVPAATSAAAGIQAAVPAAPAPGGRGRGQAGAPPEPRANVGPADRPRVEAARVARGAQVWGVDCITCHGTRARGGDGGPSLLRSPVVMHDRAANVMGPFMKKGHPMQSGKPSASLTDEQLVDLVHFVRQRVLDSLRGSAEFRVRDILTGDPKAGAAYFTGEGGCATCHSPTGNLAGIGARFVPVDLQQRMLFPAPRGAGPGGVAGTPPTTITVTPASGAPITGVLVQYDDFFITYRDAAGVVRVMRRLPTMKVAVTDPLDAHHKLLDRITDKNMHDLVAYLETLK